MSDLTNEGIIELTIKDREGMKEPRRECANANHAFTKATAWSRYADAELWEIIFSLHPEARGFKCRINGDGNLVTVRKLKLWESNVDEMRNQEHD